MQQEAIVTQIRRQFDLDPPLFYDSDQRRERGSFSIDPRASTAIHWQTLRRHGAFIRLILTEVHGSMSHDVRDRAIVSERGLGIGQLILVAEDNVINQQVIRRQINALGLVESK